MRRELHPDVTQFCEYDDCPVHATMLVYSRSKDKVLVCCAEHAKEVVEEQYPEYWHECNNCGCLLPIN